MSLTKYLRWAIVVGLFSVILITPFYVSSSMFFPFITGKGFFFRIAVEIIFALWIILAMTDSSYRPKKSPILYAVSATLLVLILSTIFGANPYRSFWSNFERMEGLITHLHLFAYFLVLISVFKSRNEWRRFFYGISVSGALMAVYGYLQALGIAAISSQSGPRADGAFGNASYMAIFILFNVFLAAYLYFSEDKRWQKNIFGVLVLFEIPVIFLTATRGAILGLIGGIILLVLILLILSKDKRVKIASVSVIGGIIILIGGFLLVQNQDFITQNPVLSRLSNLSLQDRTVQSRFSIWSISLEGFKERPLLGWGLENYGRVFNKHYKPSLWRQEPWFDRSHNIIFDWLIHAGLAGLLAYLSVFVSSFYIIWHRYVKEKSSENLMAASVLTSLFAAYAFHNLFVFDNLTSHILFFSVLGFAHFYARDEVGLALQRSPTSLTLFITPAQSFGTAFVFFGLIFSVYFLNIKPLLANTHLLRAIKDISVQGQNVDLVLSDFEKAFALGTFGTGEAREQLSSYANLVAKSSLSQTLKDEVNQVSIKELEHQVTESPNDARGYLFLSAMYDNAGRHEDALRAVESALKLSPKKQQILFLLADSHMNLRNGQKAYEAVKTAYELSSEYPQAVKNFAVIAIITGRPDEAENALRQHFGTIVVADQQLISAYARINKYDRVRDIWLKFIENEPNNAQHHINLGATYMGLGQKQKAIQELEKAVELNPSFKEQGDLLINEIKAGRNPVTR